MHKFDVEYLLNMAVVCADLEDGARLVCDARDVHRNYVITDARPRDVAFALRHLEDLRPHPERCDDVRGVMGGGEGERGEGMFTS